MCNRSSSLGCSYINSVCSIVRPTDETLDLRRLCWGLTESCHGIGMWVLHGFSSSWRLM